MYRFTSDTIDLDELRNRLRKMGGTELLHFGKAAKYRCSPPANSGKAATLIFRGATRRSSSRMATAEGTTRA